MKVAIIGGGAAGFFAAIQVVENYPEAKVQILEKSKKTLAKVKVSGGGRCNVTNGAKTILELVKGYPRGANKLKKLFREFSNVEVQKWFAEKGVLLKEESDGRVFPISDSSQTIIDCFRSQTDVLGVKIRTSAAVSQIITESNMAITLVVNEEEEKYDKVIVATGGSPKVEGLKWLYSLGHKISDPVPSLFTFNIDDWSLRKLQGSVCKNAQVSVQGTKLKATGPLLVTHWGFSGPAILKLSAFGARDLAIKDYLFKIQINWTGGLSFEEVSENLNQIVKGNPNKQLLNYKPFGVTEKLWVYIISKSNLPVKKKWSELGKKGINKLLNTLTNDVYDVKGKTTFKEEFVTCGGIAWDSIDAKTMQSKEVSGLYFAGEILDIDGITGGYNFQAAWTTAYVAARLR
ncbi:BaiN/RdsA family NAD(P)/FAD-dependent oxidoreductase [Reichenbachiella versicolor]|uniref:NAD(P)/FAD-dependent oxidoreductase n=1 Tax=Reichenbachiella versicolor TaxID=1821036 RepID=UPI000D6E9CDF|nr:NAD(P)/FAD-dependent oxidoreductase [Reichenbachiella versicolor]